MLTKVEANCVIPGVSRPDRAIPLSSVDDDGIAGAKSAVGLRPARLQERACLPARVHRDGIRLQGVRSLYQILLGFQIIAGGSSPAMPTEICPGWRGSRLEDVRTSTDAAWATRKSVR